MTQEARDSGICVDNDNDSLSSATSSSRDFYQPSYVQRLRKRFEILAKEPESEFHSECNWWLEEEAENGEEAEATEATDTKNEVLTQNDSTERKSYSKQSSLKSQVSRDSVRSGDTRVTITPATPVTHPSTPNEFPTVTFSEYSLNNETNDSDSFDSEEEDETEDQGEELEADFIRKSTNRLSRPVSITSQTSK